MLRWYQVGESVEMHCEAQEAEGTQRPSVVWRRRDGLPLQKSRVRALGGNITIDTLRRQDFGIYQCVASNEVTYHCVQNFRPPVHVDWLSDFRASEIKRIVALHKISILNSPFEIISMKLAYLQCILLIIIFFTCCITNAITRITFISHK